MLHADRQTVSLGSSQSEELYLNSFTWCMLVPAMAMGMFMLIPPWEGATPM